jgi:beta-lactamase class C
VRTGTGIGSHSGDRGKGEITVEQRVTKQPAPSFARALGLIDDWLGPQGPRGVGAAVWHGGRIVAEHYVGEARPGVPVGPDTLFGLASVTKPVTAAVVMTLIEAGLVSLDEPAGRLVPEFRAGPGAARSEDEAGVEPDPALDRLRAEVSARHLLSHTAGLPEDLGPRDGRFAEQPTLDEIIDAMCRLPLRFAPGSQLLYSNAGYGVLTRLVERVTGQEFWAVARERLLEPMGLTNTIARPSPEQSARIAELADAANPGTPIESYNSPYWRQLAIPWGGLYGTPRDLVRVAAAFLPAEDPTPLSAAGARLMTTDHARGVAGGVESARVHWEPARWGLGWEVKGEKRRHWTGDLTSPDTVCHFGQAGTLLWADPAHDLALAVFANRSVARTWGYVLPRWARLSNAVVAAAAGLEVGGRRAEVGT